MVDTDSKQAAELFDVVGPNLIKGGDVGYFSERNVAAIFHRCSVRQFLPDSRGLLGPEVPSHSCG
jgi:hypothetical protein